MTEPRALPKRADPPPAPISPTNGAHPASVDDPLDRSEISSRVDLTDAQVELSMRRTGLSIQRTRMSADRTLMSVLRTSLSLIAFGFTLHEVFQKAFEAGAIHSARSARNFGLALILLGILLLAGGIGRHVQFAVELRKRRRELVTDRLIHGQSAYPISITLLSALVLLLIGVAAVASVVWSRTFLG
jgi:uncharacterized membrane protein YidH (DUF202 family)